MFIRRRCLLALGDFVVSSGEVVIIIIIIFSTNVGLVFSTIILVGLSGEECLQLINPFLQLWDALFHLGANFFAQRRQFVTDGTLSTDSGIEVIIKRFNSGEVLINCLANSFVEFRLKKVDGFLDEMIVGCEKQLP